MGKAIGAARDLFKRCAGDGPGPKQKAAQGGGFELAQLDPASSRRSNER